MVAGGLEPCVAHSKVATWPASKAEPDSCCSGNLLFATCLSLTSSGFTEFEGGPRVALISGPLWGLANRIGFVPIRKLTVEIQCD